MAEEEEIETKLSINKKQPSPPQTETTTNNTKVSLNSMSSNFKKIFRDFRGFQESKTQHSFD